MPPIVVLFNLRYTVSVFACDIPLWYTRCNEELRTAKNKYVYTKNTNHQQMYKESFNINRNTLLHVSTLLGHLQGETFRCRYTRVALHNWVRMCCWLESSIINRNTLLHVSTLLGYLQGELILTVTLGLHFTVEWECAVDCVLRCFWRCELSAVRGHTNSMSFQVFFNTPHVGTHLKRNNSSLPSKHKII
jgi:hypothetical protein